MPTTATLIETITQALATYAPTTWTDPLGASHVTVRSGSRVVTVDPTPTGVRVVQWIDYGDGRGWCDSRNYKSAAGAVRFAEGYLR